VHDDVVELAFGDCSHGDDGMNEVPQDGGV
jgi:hypothetical protein